jgi:hypothetical protein
MRFNQQTGGFNADLRSPHILHGGWALATTNNFGKCGKVLIHSPMAKEQDFSKIGAICDQEQFFVIDRNWGNYELFILVTILNIDSTFQDQFWNPNLSDFVCDSAKSWLVVCVLVCFQLHTGMMFPLSNSRSWNQGPKVLWFESEGFDPCRNWGRNHGDMVFEPADVKRGPYFSTGFGSAPD